MQLRRLEIHGFKTFANPTSLEFPSGVTAIVGPNGSGKSNVSDAILWALGEQNVRTLRGGKLQDVIFAGCASRRPIGMAEVALTFDNSSGLLPLEYGEITVTRRVYRSEESEYFINRTPCRLRDIVDLFLDTGIGRDSYFSLNQGEIDMVLSADPEERRTLFEEAAGVKKYRLRKRESLRKLETADQNLSRIHDLISEVESRVEPLERQAEAAQKYRELTDRLHESELGAFAADWQSLSLRRDQLLLDREDARARSDAAGRALEQLAAEEQQSHEDLRRLADLLETARQGYEQVSAEQARATSRIQVLQERLSADADGASRTAARLTTIAAQQEELSASLETQRAGLFAIDHEIRQLESSLSDRRKELAAAETRWRSCAADVERAQDREVQAASQQARLQASREESARRIASLVEQLQGLNQRLADLASRRKTLQDRRAQLDEADAAANSESRALQQERDRLAQALREQDQEITGLAEAIRSHERDHAANASRLKLLEELSDQREGFYKGVRAVLQAAANGQIKGHYRAVADLLTIDRAHEAAIEAALGGSVQDIVTLNDQEAREGIYYLKRVGAGRATFLSIEIVSRLARGGRTPGRTAPGVIGLASELVEFDPLYRPVVEMLLGRVLLCDNLENGNQAARRLTQWSRIVTLDGDVISSQGAMTGGSRAARPGGSVSIVGRTGQIRELRAALTESDRRLADLRELRSKAQQAADHLAEQRSAIERDLQAAQTAGAQRARDRDHLLQEDQRLGRDERALNDEIARASDREQNERANLERLNAAPQTPAAADPAHSIESLRARAHEAETDRDRRREDLSKLQAEESGLRERRRALAPGIDHARSQIDRLAQEQRTIQAQIEQGNDARARIQAELAELDRVEQTQAQKGSQFQSEMAARRAEHEAALAALAGISEKTRQANQARETYLQELHGLESALTLVEADQARIRAVLAEDYNIPPRPPESIPPTTEDDPTAPAGESSFILHPSSFESPPRPEPRAPSPEPDPPSSVPDPVSEYLKNVPPSSQPDRDRQLAIRLRRQRRALEPVNLDAIEESAAVKERLDFLTRQRTDIEQAAQDLRAVIRKIDAEARDRFMETFEAIAVHFDDLFKQLFGGGQTRLTLTDPADPLESGLEISAQPPGKKLQNLPLLSGGERSLTAVALLFAMLRVRPIPFCIMDEVDAALDEANIGRFSDMVRTFADRTQFLIITHNRGTMEAANQLYGVTMSEPGISRTLSVHLGDIPASGNHHAEMAAAAR